MGSNLRGVFIASFAVAFGGCASMSGLDASNSFGCSAAKGVNCESISSVHERANSHNLPFQRAPLEGTQEPSSDDSKPPSYGAASDNGKISPRNMDALSSGLPIRQPPLVLRVWLAPFEDETGDLYDQSYFYTMVHSGKWVIEANRANITGNYRPVFPINKNQSQDQRDSVDVDDSSTEFKKGDYRRLIKE